MTRLSPQVKQRHFIKILRLPVTILTIWLWIILFQLITKVDPQVVRNIIIPNSYLPLHILVFLTSLSSLFVITQSFARSLIWSLSIFGFILLRQIGLGNILNLLLLIGLIVSLEVFWRKKST